MPEVPGGIEDEFELSTTILNEELGELAQAISKFKRFGTNENRDGKTAVQLLSEEVGDVYGAIRWFRMALMQKYDIVLDPDVISQRAQNKREKAMMWNDQALGAAMSSDAVVELSDIIKDTFPGDYAQ